MTDLAREASNVDSIAVDVDRYRIQSQADLEQLASVARSAKARLDYLESERKEQTRPYQAETKRIQELFRAPERAYAALLEAVRARLGRHAAEVRAAQQAQQAEAARLFAAAQAAPAQAPVLVQAGHAALAAAPAPARAEGISTRAVWRFEVTDPAAVPRDLCVPDPAAIREAVSSGVRAIPGVHVWQDEQVRVSK